MKTTATFLLGILCAASIGVSAQNKSNIMVSNAIKFLNTPYVAHTLEVNNNEELVINCDEVDCTTFVEYVLAMSLSPVEDGQVSEGDFAKALQQIRYRNGKIDGYTSRLHYNADWVNNGVRQGFLEDVTATNSPYMRKLSLNYMSSHPDLYRQLGTSDNKAKIKEIEQSLSGQEIHYIPKEKLPFNGLPWIENGDIIAITTNIPGLDVSHMGIAFYVEGKLCLLNASSKDKKVEVSKIALRQMLNENSHSIGIRVLRMKKL
ncbi:MAG: DUF1460 domain-containing protein [Bacteroides sp.]|jgi:hypothetical protein|nr:DUF1460 domain-containing protein [Bacteroides sp.]